MPHNQIDPPNFVYSSTGPRRMTTALPVRPASRPRDKSQTPALSAPKELKSVKCDFPGALEIGPRARLLLGVTHRFPQRKHTTMQGWALGAMLTSPRAPASWLVEIWVHGRLRRDKMVDEPRSETNHGRSRSSSWTHRPTLCVCTHAPNAPTTSGQAGLPPAEFKHINQVPGGKETNKWIPLVTASRTGKSLIHENPVRLAVRIVCLGEGCPQWRTGPKSPGRGRQRRVRAPVSVPWTLSHSTRRCRYEVGQLWECSLPQSGW
ncbi:hypothetical protein GmHk_U059950 [Glycine max]|nr:hypothetical protein GmHk_U059950 [Glycine max]